MVSPSVVVVAVSPPLVVLAVSSPVHDSPPTKVMVQDCPADESEGA